MPQVPYQGVPTARPEMPAPPREQITEQTPGAAFGTNIGAAVERLGTTFDQVGGELWNRAVQLQEMKNETEANNADADLTIEMGKRHADFNALQGQARADAYPQYVQDLQDMRLRYRGQLSNDSARRMFDRSSLNTMGRTIFNGAGVAAEGQRTALDDSYSAKIDTIKNSLSSTPHTEQDMLAQQAEMEKYVQAQGRARGQLPDKIADEVFKHKSDTIVHWLKGVADEQPFTAEDKYGTYAGKLTIADDERIKTYIRNKTHTVAAQQEANNINQDLLKAEDPNRYERGIGERRAEGREVAQRLAPNDPEFAQRLDTAITLGWNRSNQERRDTNYKNEYIVRAAILGAYGPTPHNDADMYTLGPKAKAAWDNLTDDMKDHYRGVMASKAAGDQRLTHDGLVTFQKYLGMASGTPDEQNEFLNLDTTEIKGLPTSKQLELFRVQEKIKANPLGNENTSRVMARVVAAGYVPADIVNDKDSRNQFRGALEGQLEDWKYQYGKYPDRDQERKIAAALIQEQHDPSKWFGRTTPMFQLPIPQDQLDAVKEQYKSKGLPVPSDEAIRMEHNRQLFQEQYGPKGKTPIGPAQTKPKGPPGGGSILPHGEEFM